MSQENSQDRRIPLHVIQKSDHEEIHFSVNYYQNRVYLDIRTWLKWPGDSGSRPSSKGISIPLELHEAFKEGVLKLLQQSELLKAANPAAPLAEKKRQAFSRPNPQRSK